MQIELDESKTNLLMAVLMKEANAANDRFRDIQRHVRVYGSLSDIDLADCVVKAHKAIDLSEIILQICEGSQRDDDVEKTEKIARTAIESYESFLTLVGGVLKVAHPG